ncbi:MAG TPA: hypothetical protein VEA41_18625, partial [Salinarimonas sp.]|nr:hypothetical protein [Salinarimonas sp.]
LVWHHCTEHGTYVVPGGVLDAITDTDSFCEQLVNSGLGEETPDGIRVRGTAGRIEWKSRLRANSQKGGSQNRASWLARRKPVGKPDESPSSTTTTTITTKDPDPDLCAASGSTRVSDPRVKPVIDRFVDRYKAHTGEDYPGSYPVAGMAIKRLPKSYSTERLIELVDKFWDAPDPWVMKGPGPRIEIWVQKIPALVKQSGMSAAELFAEATTEESDPWV